MQGRLHQNPTQRQPRIESGDHAAVLCTAVLLLTGCGDDGMRGNRGSGAEAPRTTAEVDVRIGSMEGDGADVFGSVAGLAADAAGRIFVADGQSHEVRVFDSAGRHLFSFGRQGAGPGELSAPCCMAFGADSLLWVRDGGNSRYNAYRVDASGAEYVTSIRMNHSDVNRWVALTFDADGALIDVGSRPRPEAVTPATFRFHRTVAGEVTRELPVPDPPAGAVPVHTVQRQLPSGVATLFLQQPFGPRHLIAHGPGGAFAEAVTASYEVRVRGSDGALVHAVTRDDVVAPALSPDERERAEAAIERQTTRMQIRRSDVPFGVPDRKQLLRHLEFDSDGNLWVFREGAEGAPHQADVYDRDGSFVRTVEWRERLDTFPLVLRPYEIYGVVRDSLDVQYVTRLRLR
jgi:hypothetical protein